MSDEQKNIRFNFIYNNADLLPSLLQKLQQVKREADTAFQKASAGSKKDAENLVALNKEYDSLVGKIRKLNTEIAKGSGNDNWLNSQLKAMETQERLFERRKKLAENWKYDSTPKGDQLEFGGAVKQKGYANPEFVAQIKEQFAARQAIQEAQERTAIDSERRIAQAARKESRETASLLQQQFEESRRPFREQLYSLNAQAQDYHKQWKTGVITQKQYNEEFAKLNAQATVLKNNIRTMPDLLSGTLGSTSYLGSLQQKLRSHANWILAGSILSVGAALPAGALKAITEIEQGMAGMKQVNDEVAHSQSVLNEQTNKFLDISAVYGERVNNIIEAGKLWGRAYKDLAVVNTLVHQSAVLSVADNFTLIEANKALEAAMFQYGLVAKNTTEAVAYSAKVVDVWTKIAHNAQVSAQDLAYGVERAGSVAHMTGVDFEFLNTMIAAGVRATGRSGAEIGQTIKTVLGSFHSEKAVKELDKIGISVTKIGKDGQTEFRKAQDVLLDLAVAAQTTDKNMEELFKAVSGGKFQWAKTGAILGDYGEFIRVWGDSVNSAGFAAKQVEMQLDTISRKSKTLIADMEKLAVGGGQAGLTQFFKEQIQGLDNFVVQLQKIPSSAWQAAGSLGTLAVGAYAVNTAYKAMTTAILSADAAQMAMARKNMVVLAITALSAIIYQVAEHYGALENAARKADEQVNDSIALKSQEVDMYKKQGEFVDSLISAHKKMSEQLETGVLSEEKAKVASQNRIRTEEELTKIMGEGAVERIKSAQWSEEAINSEKEVFVKASEVKKQEIRELTTQQLAATTAEIEDITKNKIPAYIADAQKFGESIQAKMKYLGIWQSAMLTYYEWQTKFHESDRDNTLKMMELHKDNPERLEYYKGQLAKAENAIQYSQGKGADISGAKLKELQKELSELSKKKLGLLTTAINYDPSSVGGNIPGDPADKNKGKGPANPPDPATMSRKRDQFTLQQQYNELQNQSKIANLQYTDSLERMSMFEDVYGKSVSTNLARMDLRNFRIGQLSTQTNQASSTLIDYEERLDLAMKKDEELNAQMKQHYADWDYMTKQQKYEAIKDNNDLKGNYTQIKWLIDKIAELKLKLVELKGETNKVQNENVRDLYSGTGDPAKIHQTELDKINYRQKIALANVDRRTPGYNLQENAINLQAINDKIRELKAREDELISQQKQATPNSKDWLEYEKALRDVRIEMSNLQVESTDLSDKFATVRQSAADMFYQMGVEQRSFNDIAKGLWNEFTRDALYALFKVKNHQGGVLSQLLGISGAFGGGSSSGFSSNFNYGAYGGGSLGVPYPKFNARGSIGNKQELSWIREGNKREAIIPLEDHKDRGRQLWLQAGDELGMTTERVPYLKDPDLAQKFSSGGDGQLISSAHLAKLDAQNAIMLQQSAMLAAIANNGQGGGTPAIIVTQVSSDQVLDVIKKNPQVIMGMVRQGQSGRM